ncbi:MAG: hypothetical protein A2X42_03240 [Candidatus Margulisbacteria bacterium GWF2_38_17]|nr:MAG: hypothetical protein A2X42_03240 [Candidatus Margulisbacteria bacterium GWF2_38_17]
MELFEYWNMILRRKGIILLSLLIIVGAAVFYSIRATPIYEANCKLLITEKNNGGILGAFEAIDLMSQIGGKSDPVNTQMEILQTRPILERVIQVNNLKDRKGNFIDSESLRKEIKLAAIRTTNLIQISYRDKNPVTATNVVNTLASVFVEQNQRLNQEEYSSARVFIEDQLKKQRDKLTETEQALLAYKKMYKTVALPEETTSRIGSLAQFETNKMEIDTKLKGAFAQEQDLNNKINGVGARNNPFYSYWWTNLEQIRNEIISLKAQKTNIDNQVDQLTSRLGQLPPKEIELARLTRDQTIANQVYSALLERYEEVQINEAGKIANIKLIEPAVVSSLPVLPQKKNNIILAVFVGLLFGGALSLFLEYIDDVPKSVDAVKHVLPYNVLGTVPYEDNLNNFFLKAAPRGPSSEALRLIHTSLKYKDIMRQKSPGLLITSALASEGKTTIIANLALSLSSAGKKVALVDLDLRKPKLTKIFNLSKEKGITNYLIGEESLSDIFFPSSSGKNITVIPAGTIPPNPTELIASERIGAMIDQLKNYFDIVLFDAPPVTLVAETLDLARFMDGIMIVVDMKNASLRSLNAAKELFQDKNLPIVGVIINKLIKERSGYSYSHYGYTYKYEY